MTPRHARFGATFLVVVAAGCGSTGDGYSLPVGSDDAGGAFTGDDARVSSSFDAHIERNHIAVKIVTLSCAGDCASVEAVATGGQPPYTFRWDDGSTSPSRTVCPKADTSYHVGVSDTGSTGEFARTAETIVVPLTADVIGCPVVGIADSGARGCVSADTMGPSTVEVDATGSTHYVANGASLPAGRYRAQWIDGCMKWAYGGPSFGWDVNDPPPGVFGGPVAMDPGYCLLVDGQNVFVAALPGLTGSAADSGTNDYASCIAANESIPAVDFDFAGGKLGVIANDLAAGDNTTGESAGGVSPTWRITFLSACR